MNYARHQTGLGSEVNARAETKVMHGFPFWRRSAPHLTEVHSRGGWGGGKRIKQVRTRERIR